MEGDVWISIARAVIFLGLPFILMVGYLQWRWTRTCDRSILVLEALTGGGSKRTLAPKEGGKVTIRNPQTAQTKTWLVNELATIDMDYPGIGLIPRFAQKTIRVAIFNEGDIEPILNRSPHRKKVMSPDVVEWFQALAKNTKSKAVKDEIDKYMEDITTSPTRELIVSPELIGNLERMSVLRTLAQVSDDLLEAMKGIRMQLTRFLSLNPTLVYVGLALTLVLLAFVTYQVVQLSGGDYAEVSKGMEQIQKALGITGE